MAIAAGEQQSGGEVRDSDGRLIVVGPGGVAIGGGGGGSDPLSDGTPGGALPSKTLWIAGADGSVLRGIAVNASGHVLTAVQNFPATQAVSDGGGSLTVDGTVTANAGTGPWPVTDNGGTLSVDDGAGSLTVDGSVTVSNFPATQPVSGTVTANAGTGPWPVTDNGGSLTVDAPAGTPVFVRLSDGTSAIATLPVSLASLPSLAAGAAVIGKVDINSAPQVAVNNVETLADNAGFTDGTSKLFPQGYVFDEVAGTALTENDIAAARVDAKRATIQVIEDATTRGLRAQVATLSDALANFTGQLVGAGNQLFNGTTWDRQHGNWRTTTGDTGAKTATYNGIAQTNYDSRGAVIVCRFGTVSGTSPTCNLTLQVSWDGGTTWGNWGANTANITASNGTLAALVYPTQWGIGSPTPTIFQHGFTQVSYLDAPLPRTWRIMLTIGGTSPSFALTAVDVLYQV